MSVLETNRDLYLAIEKLAQTHQATDRSLEEFLRTLLRAADSLADSHSLSLAEFFSLLTRAFTDEPYAFQEEWRSQYERFSEELSGYARWRALMLQQIVDLREMAESGILESPYRYFGIDSPRDARWYNFHPLDYLECAMAGSFGGWQPGDPTGRGFVPGPVAVLAEDGSLTSAHPEDIPRPTYTIAGITWAQFEQFIWCGQNYE